MAAQGESETSHRFDLRAVGRVVLWVAGSAVFGSMALVLWNRRALKSLREAAEHPAGPIHTEVDDGRDAEEIY